MAIDISPILEDVNSLSGADKANINDAVFERYRQDASFAQHHEVLYGVRANANIPVISAKPNYGFLKVSAGDCSTNSCDLDATSSNKKWNPVDYDCRVTICKQTLDADFRKFWDMNCKDFDNVEDAYVQFLIELAMTNLNASQWRIGYFDDSEDDDAAYAGIDGLFKQMAALAPAGSPNRFVIAENAEATIAEQMDLAADTAYNALKDMYDYASIAQSHILDEPNVHFDITPALAANYLSYLRDNKEVNCCFSATDGITGSRYSRENLNYMGIPLRIRSEWEGVIKWQAAKEEADNYNDPHRIVLTYKENKPVGICDDASFRSFDLWYERKDKELIMDIGTSMDAKIVIGSDFVLAM